MESLSNINDKINTSRKALCDLINEYLQGKITVRQFWTDQRILDAKVIVLGGEVKDIRPGKNDQGTAQSYLKAKSIISEDITSSKLYK